MHAVSGHKAKGQILEDIIISKLFDVGVRGLVSMLNDLGWFYTAVSRTKTRTGLTLVLRALPTDHIKTHAGLMYLLRWHVCKCSTKRPEFASTQHKTTRRALPTTNDCKMRAPPRW